MNIQMSKCCLLLVSSILCQAAVAQSAPGGSYQQSCRNTAVEIGGILRAECKRANGKWMSTSLDNFKSCDVDIVNLNGQLMCQAAAPAAPKGSYRGSCDRIAVAGDMVAARCMAGTAWKATTINLKEKRCTGGLANKNGVLACE